MQSCGTTVLCNGSLIGQMITCAKGNNLLQPNNGTAGNRIWKQAISQGYAMNKVDSVSLACKDALALETPFSRDDTHKL